MVDFNTTKFIRSGGGVDFETRDVKPSDFVDKTYGPASGDSYAKQYALNEENFNNLFPAWEAFADYFVMRRPVYTIEGKQDCATTTFKASEIASYTDTGEVTVNNFRIPGGFQGASIPSGKWLNDGMRWSDLGNKNTQVTVRYRQFLQWKLEKIQDGTPPDPTGAATTPTT